MTIHAGSPILKSMLKIFSLFMVKYQFKDDDGTGVWIECTKCNKDLSYKISETLMIDIIAGFYQSRYFSLYWSIMDDTKKELVYFEVDEHFPHWCIYWPWYNTYIFITFMDLYLIISLLLHAKIDMN